MCWSMLDWLCQSTKDFFLRTSITDMKDTEENVELKHTQSVDGIDRLPRQKKIITRNVESHREREREKWKCKCGQDRMTSKSTTETEWVTFHPHGSGNFSSGRLRLFLRPRSEWSPRLSPAGIPSVFPASSAAGEITHDRVFDETRIRRQIVRNLRWRGESSPPWS